MHKMIERRKTMLPVNLSSLRWNLQKKKKKISTGGCEERSADETDRELRRTRRRARHGWGTWGCRLMLSFYRESFLNTCAAGARLLEWKHLQHHQGFHQYLFYKHTKITFSSDFFFYDNLGFTCKIFSYVSQDNKSNWLDDHPGRSFNYFSALNQFRCMRRVEAFPRSHRGTPRTGRRLG